jgi:hypothetical protein
MAESKPKDKPTGKAVRHTKGEDPKPTEKAPVPNQGTQIHAGNIPVVTVKLLDEINNTLKRIATALEKANG